MKGMAFLPLLGFLLSPIAAGLDKDATVEDLLKKMRTAYQSVGSATLSVKLRQEGVNGVTSGLLSLDYVRPNKIRYASRLGTNETRRYSNGKQVVTIRSSNRQVDTKVDVDTLGGRVPGNLEWLCFFDWKRQLSTSPGANMEKSQLKIVPNEKWQNRTWIVLDESAPSVGVAVRYFIDPKTFFIWKCDVFRLPGRQKAVQTEVQRLTLGPSFPKNHFEPPADAGTSGPSGTQGGRIG